MDTSQSVNSNDTNDTVNDDTDDEGYGDELYPCRNNFLRIGHVNINGIPESRNDIKNVQLRQAINECEMQIMGLSEINRCWHLLEEDDR